MKRPAFIFDLDGVLTDTAELHFRSWKAIADEAGIAFDREKNELLRGVSREQSLRILLGPVELSPTQFEHLAAKKNALYVESLRQAGEEILLPGVRRFLMQCRALGIRSAIASSSKNAPAIVVKVKIDRLVDAVCCGLDVPAAKPAPDLFLHAASRIGAVPQDCIVFEDAAAGIAAARNAGMRVVGIGGADLQADFVIPSLAATIPERILTRVVQLPETDDVATSLPHPAGALLSGD